MAMVQFTRRAMLAAGVGMVGGVGLAALRPIGARSALREADSAQAGVLALQPAAVPVAMPAFRFATPQGNVRNLADYRGKGIVLNIWATWCPPCSAEMPALDALAARLAPDGVVVLPVSVDQAGAAAVTAFFRAHRITHLPVLLDLHAAAMKVLGVRGIPTSILIDRHGLERARLTGGADWHSPSMEAAIRQLVT